MTKAKELLFVSLKVWKIFVGIVFTIATLISLIIIGILGIGLANIFWTLLLTFLTGIIVCGTTLLLSWNSIPEKNQWIVEEFGDYIDTPLEPGLHLIFPFFQEFLIKIEAKVYMGMQIMELYLDEKIKSGFGGSSVDFADGSATVEARVLFTIKDAAKATYSSADIFKVIEEKMDNALRSYLGHYSIDQTSKLKVHFDKYKILNGIIIRESEDGKLTEHKTAEVISSGGMEKEILDKLGVEIDEILVTDIVLPEEIKTQRRKIIEAAKNLEASGYEADQIKLLAEANKEALNLNGAGLGQQIGHLLDKDIPPEAAVELIKKLKLFEQIKENALIIESGGAEAGKGAKFGSGFGKGKKITDK